MKYNESNTLKRFADNAQIIKSEFIWHNTLTKRLAALLYAQDGKTVDCEAIRQCHTLIKQNTGVFSNFRGNMVLCMAALLSLSPSPQEIFSQTLKAYELLRGLKFHASDFLVMAAYEIAKQGNPSDYAHIAARARSFYDGMKAYHFFHTGQDDYIFAAMLGLTDLDTTAGSERIEQLYNRLKGEFWDKNSVQALAQVLVLSNSDDEVVNRILVLRNELRAQKIKLDKADTLPVLGILALLPVEIDTIVRNIRTALDTLRAQKGFGTLSITTQELLLFAASIVAGDYAVNLKDGILTPTLSTSITNIILAQQTAMIAAMTASTVAASSSSSS